MPATRGRSVSVEDPRKHLLGRRLREILRLGGFRILATTQEGSNQLKNVRHAAPWHVTDARNGDTNRLTVRSMYETQAVVKGGSLKLKARYLSGTRFLEGKIREGP